MEFTESLKKNYEFRRLYNKGKSAAAPYVVVYARKTKENTNRLGITVSNKIGKAVVRNKVRRRLREIYRLHEQEMLKGYELVFVARGRSVDATYQQLEQAVLKCCRQLKVMKEGNAV